MGSDLRVNLVASPFEQPLGRRTLGEIWSRQARWARLRRVTFPLFFAPEILTGAVVPLAAGAGCGGRRRLQPAAPRPSPCWRLAYLPECALAWAKGWYLSPRMVPAMMVRD